METKEYVIKKSRKMLAEAKTKEEVEKADVLFRKISNEIFMGRLGMNVYEEFEEAKESKIREIEKKMSYEEFKETFQENNKHWKFDLFEIRCKKCGSSKVEFNSDMEFERGYYSGDASVEGKIIIKCHDCGNAFTLDFWDLEK